MKLLKDRILKDGVVKPGNILKDIQECHRNSIGKTDSENRLSPR